MMKYKFILFYLIVAFIGALKPIYALIGETGGIFSSLEEQRATVIKRYLNDLQKADYKDMETLFTKDAIVISTGKGKVNAREFFNSFLPQVSHASTQLHNIFVNKFNYHITAARFHLDYELKDGEKNSGEYMDEFKFKEGSAQLVSVYMFENLKFESE